MYAPRKTRGTEMPNHKARRATIDRTGIAPVDEMLAMLTSRMRKMMKQMPG